MRSARKYDVSDIPCLTWTRREFNLTASCKAERDMRRRHGGSSSVEAVTDLTFRYTAPLRLCKLSKPHIKTRSTHDTMHIWDSAEWRDRQPVVEYSSIGTGGSLLYNAVVTLKNYTRNMCERNRIKHSNTGMITVYCSCVYLAREWRSLWIYTPHKKNNPQYLSYNCKGMYDVLLKRGN